MRSLLLAPKEQSRRAALIARPAFLIESRWRAIWPNAAIDARGYLWFVAMAGDTPAADKTGRYLLVPRPAALSENSSGSNWRPYWDVPDAYRLWTVTLGAQGPNGRPISPDRAVSAPG